MFIKFNKIFLLIIIAPAITKATKGKKQNRTEPYSLCNRKEKNQNDKKKYLPSQNNNHIENDLSETEVHIKNLKSFIAKLDGATVYFKEVYKLRTLNSDFYVGLNNIVENEADFNFILNAVCSILDDTNWHLLTRD